jgi:hypothetical protein
MESYHITILKARNCIANNTEPKSTYIGTYQETQAKLIVCNPARSVGRSTKGKTKLLKQTTVYKKLYDNTVIPRTTNQTSHIYSDNTFGRNDGELNAKQGRRTHQHEHGCSRSTARMDTNKNGNLPCFLWRNYSYEELMKHSNKKKEEEITPQKEIDYIGYKY